MHTLTICFVGSYTHILRLLVSEFTLSENPANTTCSLLRAACHADESILLGASPLLNSDHRIVEDQVGILQNIFKKLPLVLVPL